jgi:integrase
MARVHQRKDRDGWFIDFAWGGKRYREFAGDAIKKADAVQYLAKRMREVQKGDIYDVKPGVTMFADFAETFLELDAPDKVSKDRDISIVKMLKAEWRGLTLDDITLQRLDKFKAKRLKYRGASTVIKELQLIKRLLKMAVGYGKLKTYPALMLKLPKAPKGRKAWLAPDKYADFLEALPEWLLPFARLAWATGARRGELLDLKWADVDLKAGTLVFRDTKNGEDRTQYLNATARALLESLPSRTFGHPNVFPAPATKSRRVEGKLTRAQEQERMRNAYEVKIGRAWRDTAVKVGLLEVDEHGRGQNRFRLHDTRHQSGSDLRRAGQDMKDVQTFLGHKSPTMTQRYVEIQPDQERRASVALDRMAVTLPREKNGTTMTPEKTGSA